MGSPHVIATLIAFILFFVTLLASHFGWGLPNDATALAQARSVRTGSLHSRYYYGGGPGFGK